MSVYTDVFTAKQISPSQVDYVAYVMMTDIHAVWPFEALPDAYITPNKIDIQALSSGLRFFMPKANLVSVGQDSLISNRGSVSFLVTDVDGNTIVQIEPGLSWMVWVEDNTTAPGVWRAIQFGAGVSQANAGALAGAGLRAVSSRLDQNLPTQPLLSDYIVAQGDRARVLQNNGGSVTWTSDTPPNLGNGFFFYLLNSGTGTVTFDPPGGVLIDGQTTKVFQPGENAVVFSDGFNFFSLGYGRSLANTVTGAAISLAPGGLRTLTPVEVAAQVQDFSGALTSNAIVEYGTGVGYWFVWNNTNGAHTLTARTSALDTGVTIPQGNFSILRSNGSEMEVAFTATTGTVTSVGTVVGELVGGPITSTGILGLADTTVVPGAYGNADHVPTITFDQKGRATAAADTLIQISTSQVTGLDNLLKLLVPPGTGPIPFAGGAAPTGWLRCDGATYPTATYPDLFAAIGYTYGGSGANFAVPDMRGVLAAGMDLMPGSLMGNANRISSFVPSTTVGGFGGGQLQSAGVSVSGGISGSTFGGLSVSVSGSGTTETAFGGSIGAPGSGTNAMTEGHQHNFSLTSTGGTSGSLGVTGSFSGSGGTNNFGIVQPTRVFIFIIKT